MLLFIIHNYFTPNRLYSTLKNKYHLLVINLAPFFYSVLFLNVFLDFQRALHSVINLFLFLSILHYCCPVAICR